jgi:hypothetical protein
MQGPLQLQQEQLPQQVPQHLSPEAEYALASPVADQRNVIESECAAGAQF